MAKLKGILKQNVTVEVNAKECFMALTEELGFIELFKTERDEFFILLPPTDTEPPYMVCKKTCVITAHQIMRKCSERNRP